MMKSKKTVKKIVVKHVTPKTKAKALQSGVDINSVLDELGDGETSGMKPIDDAAEDNGEDGGDPIGALDGPPPQGDSFSPGEDGQGSLDDDGPIDAGDSGINDESLSGFGEVDDEDNGGPMTSGSGFSGITDALDKAAESGKKEMKRVIKKSKKVSKKHAA